MNDFDIEQTLNSNAVNISKDMLEIGVDSILEDGLLKDIPVIGTLLNITKAGINIKDRLFIKKLICFLYETQNIPADKREHTIREINESNDFKSKVGEKLIFILDKSDEIEKTRLIGQLFCFVLSREIGYHMFIRCSEAINKIFSPDLKWFLSKSHFEFNDRIERDNLFNAGILKIIYAEGETMFDGSSFNLRYEISEVGLCLHRYLGNSRIKIESISSRLENKSNNKW